MLYTQYAMISLLDDKIPLLDDDKLVTVAVPKEYMLPFDFWGDQVKFQVVSAQNLLISLFDIYNIW